MSEDRQTLPSDAVDQGARANQTPEEEPVPTQDDIMEQMRQQLEELEAGAAKHTEEMRERDQRLARERSAREEAERRAREADVRAGREANAGRFAAEDAQLDAIGSSLSAHESQLSSLKGQYAAAFSEGDAVKMADIQGEMAKVGAKIVQLDAGKAQLEARKQTRGQAQDAPPQPSADEARENFIRQQPGRVQDWLRSNPRYFDDAGFRNRTVAAAGYATEIKGYAIDSQEYIDFVNEELGLTQRREREPEPPTRQQNTRSNGRDADRTEGQPRQADRRMVAAPAGGSVPGTSRSTGADNNQVYLTKGEKEMAATLGLSEAEYATHKRELLKENRIGPNAHR